MQSGVVGLRGAIIAAWEKDLRAVRQDTFDVGRGREALLFIQRFYGLVSLLRPQIQRAWGPGLVHVVDSPDIAGPGPRVSQTRLKLRNHGEHVSPEVFTHVDGTPRANAALGTERLIKVAEVEPLSVVNEMYRLLVDFLQVALNLDLGLGGSTWLYEHVGATSFVSSGRWASVGEIYRHATREFAVENSFESVFAMLASPHVELHAAGGPNGATAAAGDGVELPLSIEQLQRFVEPQPDLENFVALVGMAVAADPEDRRVTSAEVVQALGLDQPATTRLGQLVARAPDVAREGEHTDDFSSWSFLPSYNVHFFRKVHSIDDFLAMEAKLLPRAAPEGTTITTPGTSFKVDDGASLPDGIVTFLMTDVVESTPLWLQRRSSMYLAMRRHDQVLTAAIEANGGIVLKERGEGDSFFAVFPRATDAVAAAVEAQRAVQAEPWPDGLTLRVRMAVLTGEADARDRDYRSPAVNRCAKLRRRAVGAQVLVSEATYSIVADILRDDIRLVSVGKRMLEGHDRPEEVYVLEHPDLDLELAVAEDAVVA